MQLLSEADRRVVPVAKIVPGAALIISGTPTALAKFIAGVTWLRQRRLLVKVHKSRGAEAAQLFLEVPG